jgi:hypothetical protein
MPPLAHCRCEALTPGEEAIRRGDDDARFFTLVRPCLAEAEVTSTYISWRASRRLAAEHARQMPDESFCPNGDNDGLREVRPAYIAKPVKVFIPSISMSEKVAPPSVRNPSATHSNVYCDCIMR